MGGISSPYLYFHRKYEKSITVFNYHDVTDHPSEFQKKYELYVSKKVFEKQISEIIKKLIIIHPNELVEKNVLPSNAALITFDDGFSGAFQYGIPYLISKNIPSIMFLNLETIEKQEPMVSAIASYLEYNVEDFKDYALSKNIKKPCHLNLTPEKLKNIKENFSSLNMNQIWEYQGELTDIDTISNFSDSSLVVYANHLYNHWNAEALNDAEFQEQYKKNEIGLRKFKNYINFFAFTNGQPYTCFNKRHIEALKNFGTKKIFSTYAGVNHDENSCLYGRLSMVEKDYSISKINFRLLQSIYKDKYKNLNKKIQN